MIKVLIVSESDSKGGASRAAKRLHDSLILSGIHSSMLVLHKATDDTAVIRFEPNFFSLSRQITRLINYFFRIVYPERRSTLFTSSLISNRRFFRYIKRIKPDVIHFHWIPEGVIAVSALRKIRVPVVITQHDMWTYTGGCHYTDGCALNRGSCGKCPLLGSSKKSDLSHKNHLRKQQAYSNTIDLTFVSLSKWMFTQSQASSLGRTVTTVKLPNPIDTDLYAPVGTDKARSYLGLPQNEKIILFGAVDAFSKKRKGFRYFADALQDPRLKNHIVAIFGNQDDNPFGTDLFPQKTICFGMVRDDKTLINLYSAADVVVVPSMQENLANVIMESMSCGTPVVAFDIGGNADMIQHKRNGYLAKPFLYQDIANGISKMLEKRETVSFGREARSFVKKNFSCRIVGEKYKCLYLERLH